MDKSEEAVRVYNKIAESYAKEFMSPSDYINDFLSLVVKKGKILDIGCGVGIDANYMASKGFKVIGIDLSKEMLKLAKQKFPKIDFRLGDMRKSSFKSNFFNGIFAAYSLIHLPKEDVLDVLKSLHKFLKIKGVIYIAVHEGKSSEIFVTGPLKPDEKTFLDIFSFKELKELLEKAGFSIIRKYRREPKKKEEFDFVKLFVLAKKRKNNIT